MRLGRAVLALSPMLFLVLPGCAAAPRYAEGRSETILSGVLDEDRPLTVHVPAGCAGEAGRACPLVVALDAPGVSETAAGLAAELSGAGVIPPVIVVGVVNLDAGSRNRDLTPPFLLQDIDRPDGPRGRGDRFMTFLGEELLPWIEERYGGHGTRVLVGWSRGALFSAWSLIDDPDLFDARIALSPAFWREDSAIAGRFARFFVDRPALRTTVYMTLGSRENTKMKAGYERTIEVFRQSAPEGLRWQSRILDGANHEQAIEAGLPAALTAVLAEH